MERAHPLEFTRLQRHRRIVAQPCPLIPGEDAIGIILLLWRPNIHVAEWWHDPETLEFVGSDLDHPDLAQFIVGLAGRPFAYLQCYQIGDWHKNFGPQPRAPAASTSSSARQI